jgi:serine protease
MTDSNLRLGRRRFIQSTGLLAALGGVTGLGSASSGGGKYNVSFHDDTDRGEAANVLDEQLGADHYELLDHNDRVDISQIELTDAGSEAVEDPVDSVESHDAVKYGERVKPAAVPDVPSEDVTLDELRTQTDSNDPIEGWWVDAVNLPAAWDQTLGSTDVTLVVHDTKIQWTHPDLTDRFTEEKGGSYTDTDPSNVDFQSHGTWVSGCAAATTDNGLGVAGTSDSRLLGYDLRNRTPLQTQLTDAVENGADVINFSWRTKSFGENDDGELVWREPQALKEAIQEVAGDVILVSSAGNDRDKPNLPDTVGYPAKFDEVIAVGATDRQSLTDFSSRGAVDVCAPGADVVTTAPGDNYGRVYGTSFASPITAGVVALMLDIDPSLGGEEVETILEETATDIEVDLSDAEDGVTKEALVGAGQIDAAAAVERVAGDEPSRGEADLQQSVYTGEVEGTTEFTVELSGTDTATLQVGSGADSNYYAAAELAETDGDGSVVVAFDADAAGTDQQVLTTPDSDVTVSKVTQGGGFDGSAPLDAGDYPLRVRAGEKSGDSLAEGDADAVGTLVLEESEPEQAPYNGPHELPGRVQAEDFDTGGQGVAYNDTSAENRGGAYRDTEVDIGDATEGGYFVGWIEAGEWWEYTVEVTEAGTYPVEALVASDDDGGSFTVEAGGESISTSFEDTGGWQSWTTVSVGELELEAGETVVRITSDERLWNLNWFEFVADSEGGTADVESGVYELHNVQTGRIADVAYNSQDDGANVIQYADWDGENQRFQLSPDGDAYTLTAQHSDKYLSASDGNVVQDSSDEEIPDTHRWTFESVDAGYVVENVANGEVMTVEDPEDRWGGNIGTDDDDEAATQQWELVEV